jgi:ribosomal protein S18 acetylase RimI-like enzyme
VEIIEDRWLSERFRHPVFTVRATGDGDHEALSKHATGQGHATYQARVPVAEVSSLLVLMETGMQVVSVNLTLSHDLRELPAPTSPEGLELRVADPERDTALPELAERAFSHSRFHQDPDIPDPVAARIKRDWAENCLRGARGDQLLVAARGGQAIGFLVGMTANDFPTIDLIAVDPAAQRTGVGRSLVERFTADSAAAGAPRARVGTPAANKTAIRFYQRLGWTLEHAAYDLHMHVGTEGAGG